MAVREKPLRWHRYTEEYRKMIKIQILNENKGKKITVNEIRQIIASKLYGIKSY